MFSFGLLLSFHPCRPRQRDRPGFFAATTNASRAYLPTCTFSLAALALAFTAALLALALVRAAALSTAALALAFAFFLDCASLSPAFFVILASFLALLLSRCCVHAAMNPATAFSRSAAVFRSSFSRYSTSVLALVSALTLAASDAMTFASARLACVSRRLADLSKLDALVSAALDLATAMLPGFPLLVLATASASSAVCTALVRATTSRWAWANSLRASRSSGMGRRPRPRVGSAWEDCCRLAPRTLGGSPSPV